MNRIHKIEGTEKLYAALRGVFDIPSQSELARFVGGQRDALQDFFSAWEGQGPWRGPKVLTDMRGEALIITETSLREITVVFDDRGVQEVKISFVGGGSEFAARHILSHIDDMDEAGIVLEYGPGPWPTTGWDVWGRKWGIGPGGDAELPIELSLEKASWS